MNFSRQFAAGIATLISLGFVALDYLFHHSHVTLFLFYFWMVLYFLFAMVVMIGADIAFQIGTGGWWSPSKAMRYSKVIGRWALSALVLWLAFWRQHVFLWIVFALALTVLFWIRFRKDPIAY